MQDSKDLMMRKVKYLDSWRAWARASAIRNIVPGVAVTCDGIFWVDLREEVGFRDAFHLKENDLMYWNEEKQNALIALKNPYNINRESNFRFIFLA